MKSVKEYQIDIKEEFFRQGIKDKQMMQEIVNQIKMHYPYVKNKSLLWFGIYISVKKKWYNLRSLPINNGSWRKDIDE